jgi:hypothetical protein
MASRFDPPSIRRKEVTGAITAALSPCRPAASPTSLHVRHRPHAHPPLLFQRGHRGDLAEARHVREGKGLRPGASGEATIRNGTSALRFHSHVSVCAMFAHGANRAKNRQPIARSGRTRIYNPSQDKTTIGTGPSARDPSRLSLYRSWHTLCFFHSSEPVLRRPGNAEDAWYRHTAR